MMPVAFRRTLESLIDCYRDAGGLTRFVLDQRSKSLPGEVIPLLENALAKIQQTIIKGPVSFAGGSLQAGRVFHFNARTQEILMGAALWRELSLLGHWIQDAVLLRWAELTSDISHGTVKPSEAIDLLLTVPIPERDVTDARTVYGALSS